MNFTTKVSIEKLSNSINYNSKIVSIGSCFAENIGAKFDYFKFQNSVNDFGIIFNPVSIENLIFRAVKNLEFTENDIFFHNEQWHCFEVHSDKSNSNKEEFLQYLNQILKEFKTKISEATHIVITLGTAWVYRNKESNKIVANCYKVAQNQFKKEILSVEIIEKSIHNSIELVHKENPNCNFIFTVSPVRHIKDGFVENQLSKAHLISAIHQVMLDCLLERNREICNLNYFPSYEILMDELRDYRFYADDMLHPNQTAINYIWERFSETSISQESYAIMEEVTAIQRALSHRAFNPNSESHLKFLSLLEVKIYQLQQKMPFLKFS